MYKRTIWQDHVEGIQDGTDMNAANFNNLEAGVMEAAALAAFNAANVRYNNDIAKNAEIFTFVATLTGSYTDQFVAIPEAGTRNMDTYSIVSEIVSVTDGTAGDIIINGVKLVNQFMVKYNGTASAITVRFYLSGGMT